MEPNIPPTTTQGTSLSALTTDWAIFAPLLNVIDQTSRRAAREEYAKLQTEQAAAEAKARRDEEPIDNKEAATLLGVIPQTTWEYYRKGLLNGSKVGGRILFRRGDVLALLQSQTNLDGRRKYARRATTQKSR
jgi:hypothetical protein